jgi:hypothetical protein
MTQSVRLRLHVHIVVYKVALVWPAVVNTVKLEICSLLDNYTASCGNYLPTFRDK